MDSSQPFRIDHNGVCYGSRQGAPESYPRPLTNLNHVNTRPILDDGWETTGQLVSAVLDDTATIEQQLSYGNAKQPMAAPTRARLPVQSMPYSPPMVEPVEGLPVRKGVSRANMSAFQANRLHAEARPNLAFPNQPTTSLQPKTTSRQRKGTVRTPRPYHGSSGTGSTVLAHRTPLAILDQYQPALKQSRFFPRPNASQQPSVLVKDSPVEGSEFRSSVQEGRHNLKRQSTSIVALTDATKLVPQDAAAIRRSQTMRDSRKTGLTKQRSVLKKMTIALTDRLHLTGHKAPDVQPHEADGDRGSGFYNYETNQFIRDVVADIPTQKRQLPSRLAEIYEREEPNDNTRHGEGDSFDGTSPSKRHKSSTSKDSNEDPFADPDCTEELSSDFVSRLKATTPTKDGGMSAPVTPTASSSHLKTLLRGSINSLLPFPPLAASTPRITVNRRRSYGADQLGGQLKVVRRMSMNDTSFEANGHCGEADAAFVPSESDAEKDVPPMALNHARIRTCTYRPVLHAPNRKKHPSPNKQQLEVLESQLRRRWPETLSQATENAKKHPSPLKMEIQALGEKFRQTYPDLLGGNTPTHKERSHVSHCAKKSEDETDELAMSFTSTPETRRVTRQRKVSSVACFSQTTVADVNSKRKTLSMSTTCGTDMNRTSPLQLACPAYHQA